MPVVRGDRRLLQEILLLEDGGEDPRWAMLCGCMLLNLTQRKQVDRVWPALFRTFPAARFMEAANLETLQDILRPLGLQERRASTLMRFSGEWRTRDVAQRQRGVELMLFHGIGEYARDSWMIFVEEELPVDEPADKELLAFLEEFRDSGFKTLRGFMARRKRYPTIRALRAT